MVTWADVQRWDPAALEPVIDAVSRAENRMLGQADETKAAGIPAGWTGEAAVAAAGKLQRVGDTAELTAAELAATKRCVMDAADGIAGLVRGIEEARELAGRYGFTITASGEVPPLPCTADQPLDVVEHRRRVHAELLDRVEQTLRHADDIDRDVCGVLRRILDGQLVDVTDNTRTGLAAYAAVGAAAGALSELLPPAGATAGDNAAWWATLSEQARAELITVHPELVGSREGLPTLARDAANRKLLDEADQRLRQRLDRLRQQLAGDTDAAGIPEQIDAMEGKLRGIETIRQRLAGTADAPAGERFYLLAIDGHGDGRAIVAKGNPDTAVNVATYVPGTGSDLAGIGTTVERAAAMFRATNQAASPSASTSVLAWCGYDAPDDLLDALSEDYAAQAREDLDAVQAGLRASHDDSLPPAHQTVLGHSYGGTVVGFAARDDGVAADDLVFVAAPGVGVERAAGLRIPDGQVWATSDPADPVGDTQIFGNDPTDPDFGALRFESDSPTVESAWYDPATHSDYWEPRNPSLRAMGHIIAGAPVLPSDMSTDGPAIR